MGIRPLAGLRHARRSQNTVASLGMKFIRPLNSSLNQGNTDTGALELRAVASHLMGDNNSPLTSRLAGQSAFQFVAGLKLS